MSDPGAPVAGEAAAGAPPGGVCDNCGRPHHTLFVVEVENEERAMQAHCSYCYYAIPDDRPAYRERPTSGADRPES